jgi:hypothetical protein
MDTVFWIIKVIFTLVLLTCPLVCLYWVFKPPEYFLAQHKRISATIYVCGFLAFWVIIGTGLDLYLWFIPDRWAYRTDEGDIQFVRETIKACLAFGITFCLASVLEKACLEKHREQTEEDIMWKIKRYKMQLDTASKESDRSEILSELKAEKSELEKLNLQNKLTPWQEKKLRVLWGLFNELGEE